MDLSSLSDNESSAFLTENEVVLSDNTLEVLLGEADEEQRVTETIPNAIEADTLPLFQNASFDGSLYLGILANTERQIPIAMESRSFAEGESTIISDSTVDANGEYVEGLVALSSMTGVQYKADYESTKEFLKYILKEIAMIQIKHLIYLKTGK